MDRAQITKDTPIILVGHNKPDLDCIIALLLMKVALNHKDYQDITFSFIPQGTTYQGIKVDAEAEYDRLAETSKGFTAVTHLDCGFSRFDHHRDGLKGKSAAELIWEHFRIWEFAPEWRRMVQIAKLDDQGKLRRPGKGQKKETYAYLAYALETVNKSCPDGPSQVFYWAMMLVEAIVREWGIWREVKENAYVEQVENLLPLPDASEFAIYADSPLGRLGVAQTPRNEHFGSILAKLPEDCVVTVAHAVDTGRISVLSDKIDLRQVLYEIRKAEAAIFCAISRCEINLFWTDEELLASGTVQMLDWFGHQPTEGGPVIGVLHASPKADLNTGLETHLSFTRVVAIVLQALEMHSNQQS